MDPLLLQIEAFLEAHDIGGSTFGERALGDRHFVRQMRTGRDPSSRVRAKVLAYMQEAPAPLKTQADA